MVEHAVAVNGRVRIDGSAKPRQAINPRGSEAAGWRNGAARRRASGLHRLGHACCARPGARAGVSPPLGEHCLYRRRNRGSGPRAPRNSRSAIRTLFRWRPQVGPSGRRTCRAPGGPRYRGAHARHYRARHGRRSAVDFRRRLRGQVRRGGARSGRHGRRVLLRPRADSARPAAGVRARWRQVLFRIAWQPRVHNGHLSNFSRALRWNCWADRPRFRSSCLSRG